MPNEEFTTLVSSHTIIDDVYFKAMVNAVISNAQVPGAFTPELIEAVVRSYLENRRITHKVEELATSYIEFLLQNGIATKIGDHYVIIGSKAHEYLLAASESSHNGR